jgi:cardiolipin synthase
LGFLAGCNHSAPEIKVGLAYGVEDPQFEQTITHLFGPPMSGGNSIVTLNNGDEIFPQMLGAIAEARTSITFETFVYWSGKVGKAFTEALVERAQAGVKVHVMIDAVGSDRIDKAYIRQMKEAGVEVDLYNPLRWYDLGSTVKLNNRTHRKLLVVDGKVGFTGGVGIADEWLGNADAKDHWRDTHYRVEGPVVAQLQAAFADHWVEANGGVLHGYDYFPPEEKRGALAAQVFKSSPRGGSEAMQLVYLYSIAAARKHIRLATPYFVPDKTTIWHLVEARKRGVRVQIIAPDENIDVPFVRSASHAVWGELLKAGVEIYEYQPTMYHVKLMIVDDLWTSVGSANIDNRSFRLNSEANLNVLDGGFAQEQVRMFEEDLSKSKRITYEQWKRRPWYKKLGELLPSLFAPLL